jgi:hypothetical protein
MNRLRTSLKFGLCALALGGFLCSPGSIAAADPHHIPLPMKTRIYLAKIEERGLTLSNMGFPAVKAAIKSGDPARVRTFLADDFSATVLDVDDGPAQTQGVVTMKRFLPDNPAVVPRQLEAAGFVDWLLALKRRFGGEVKLDWKLKNLVPVIKNDAEGAYAATGQLRFAGKTPEGHPLEMIFEIAYDLTPIPEPDVIAETAGWLRSFAVTSLHVGRSPEYLLVDVAAERGIDARELYDNWKQPPGNRIVTSGGVYLADINDDGFTDILVTDVGGPHLYLASPEGKFRDVTRGSGLSPSRQTTIAVFGDFDNDGLPDLILDNQALKNIGGGRFRNVTGRSSLRLTDATTLSVVDYDRDGKLDLYVSRQHGSGMTGDSWISGPGGPGNQLWRNLGDWQFENVTAQANAEAGKLSCFTTVWLDVNNDGWPDAYSINEFGGGRLLVNQGDGTFISRPLRTDWNDFGSMGLQVADVNNDGFMDIFTDNMFTKAGRRTMENLPEDSYPPEVMKHIKRFVTGSELYINEGGLSFRRAGHDMHVYQVGWSYGPSFVDLDNDGFQDLYATSGFMTVDNDEPDG